MNFRILLPSDPSYIVFISHVHTPRTVHDYIINNDWAQIKWWFTVAECTANMYSQSDRSAEHMTIEKNSGEWPWNWPTSLSQSLICIQNIRRSRHTMNMKTKNEITHNAHRREKKREMRKEEKRSEEEKKRHSNQSLTYFYTHRTDVVWTKRVTHFNRKKTLAHNAQALRQDVSIFHCSEMNETSEKRALSFTALRLHLLWVCPAAREIWPYRPGFAFVVLVLLSLFPTIHLFRHSTFLNFGSLIHPYPNDYCALKFDSLRPVWITYSTGTRKNFVDYLRLTSKLWACSNCVLCCARVNRSHSCCCFCCCCCRCR